MARNTSTTTVVTDGKPKRRKVVLMLPWDLWREIGVQAARNDLQKSGIVIEALQSWLATRKKAVA